MGGNYSIYERVLLQKEYQNSKLKKRKLLALKSLLLKKWCMLFTHRPPNFPKTEFFEEISVALNKALNKYNNLLIAGDLNINTLRPTSDSSKHLSDLNDSFNLVN